MHGPPLSLDQTVVIESAKGMLIGRCRDEPRCRYRRVKDRDDATMQGSDDHTMQGPDDPTMQGLGSAGTGECNDWIVKGLEVQGLEVYGWN